MSLDEYEEPKGAYYTPALVARFEDEASAEAAIDSLHDAGFSSRDIQVGRGGGHWHRQGQAHHVTIIVSEPTPGMLTQARALLAASAASEIEPYGAGA